MAPLHQRLRQMFEFGAHPLTLTDRHAGSPGDGLTLSQLTFATATGDPVRGMLCRPVAPDPCPAVLVLHAHGDHYDIGASELMQGRPALHAPLGPALAALGIASLCLDLPCFGLRRGMPESAAAKAALWQGRSLAGQMLGESHAALDWLAAEPGIRADRIGLFGISMGATLGYWLAAVDDRIRAVAQECCLADYGRLIATGAHDLHGIYLTIPGLLPLASNGRIAGLVAPRAQFIGLGDTDPLTPPDAADAALSEVHAAYQAQGGTLHVHREPDSGHVETAAMRAAVLGFLAKELLDAPATAMA